MSAGDAPQELLEITLPEPRVGENPPPPQWHLLGREKRGQMACVVAPNGASAACAVRHVTSTLLRLWLLDLRHESVRVGEGELTECEWVTTCPSRPEVRFADGIFEVKLQPSDPDRPARWIGVRPRQADHNTNGCTHEE